MLVIHAWFGERFRIKCGMTGKVACCLWSFLPLFLSFGAEAGIYHLTADGFRIKHRMTIGLSNVSSKRGCVNFKPCLAVKRYFESVRNALDTFEAVGPKHR